MAGLSGVSAWRDSTNFSSGPGAGSGLEVLLQGFPDDLYLQLHGSFGAGDHPADLGVGMALELPDEDLLELFGKLAEQPVEFLASDGCLWRREAVLVVQFCHPACQLRPGKFGRLNRRILPSHAAAQGV